MNEIVEKVRAFAQENELFAPGQRLCAAVSGGADSMALLRLLLLVQPVFGYKLTACHVNHGLRGEPADRDEAFVRAECARLNVPGENQRVKLAYFIGKEDQEPTLFIFDEPTTGLHFHDIKRLLHAFNALIERGHSLVVIEHNLDVIKCADYAARRHGRSAPAGGVR